MITLALAFTFTILGYLVYGVCSVFEDMFEIKDRRLMNDILENSKSYGGKQTDREIKKRLKISDYQLNEYKKKIDEEKNEEYYTNKICAQIYKLSEDFEGNYTDKEVIELMDITEMSLWPEKYYKYKNKVSKWAYEEKLKRIQKESEGFKLEEFHGFGDIK